MHFTYRSFLYNSYHPGVYNIIKDFVSFLQPGHKFCCDKYYEGLFSAHILHDAGHGFIFCSPQNRPSSLFSELRKQFVLRTELEKGWLSCDNGAFLVTTKKQTSKKNKKTKFVYFLITSTMIIGLLLQPTEYQTTIKNTICVTVMLIILEFLVIISFNSLILIK